VNLSLFYMLRSIVNSNPHPAFAFELNDDMLGCLSVSVCLLLLLVDGKITMQVRAYLPRLDAHPHLRAHSFAFHPAPVQN
jgi:hypothetical protein